MSVDPRTSPATIVQSSVARQEAIRRAREHWEDVRLATEKRAEPLYRLRNLVADAREDYPGRPAAVILEAAKVLSECGVAGFLDEVATSPPIHATPEARPVAAEAVGFALRQDRASLVDRLESLRAVTPGLWFGFWAELKGIAVSLFIRHLDALARDLATTPGSDGMLFLHPFFDSLRLRNKGEAEPPLQQRVVHTRHGSLQFLNTARDIVRRMEADGVAGPFRASSPPLSPTLDTEGRAISTDYPAEVIAEITDVLQWIDSHAGGPWSEMGALEKVYDRWRDIIHKEQLLNKRGTMTTLPGLSSFGRVWLLKHTAPRADGRVPKADKKKGGRPRLQLTGARYQVYDRIRREHKAGTKPADIPGRLKTDKDFMAQVREAEETLGSKLVRKALAYFSRPRQ